MLDFKVKNNGPFKVFEDFRVDHGVHNYRLELPFDSECSIFYLTSEQAKDLRNDLNDFLKKLGID